MNALRITTAIGALFVATTAGHAQINCQTDKRRAEKIICENYDLLALDKKLNEAYTQATGAMTDPAYSRMVRTQQELLRKRNECRTPACIRNLYAKRLEELEKIIEGQI